jgi:hypothetical protein
MAAAARATAVAVAATVAAARATDGGGGDGGTGGGEGEGGEGGVGKRARCCFKALKAAAKASVRLKVAAKAADFKTSFGRKECAAQT